MALYLDDGDLKLHQGDCLEVLCSLPDASVDCVVTSPPYFGLRDYGTGQWEGGNPDCDHMEKVGGTGASTLGAASGGNDMSDEAREQSITRSYVAYRNQCGKCGARRVDRQLGLEATPAEFVQRMVELFREVRRVLADHGTVWLNLGDSYAANRSYQVTDNKHTDVGNNMGATVPQGLKSKDLIGIPWRVAFALQDDGWYLRSDIVWWKPNPMPESVEDRPTKSHEYVFLLTKKPKYYYDRIAVLEPHESVRWGGRYHKDNPTEKYRNVDDKKIAGGSKTRSDRPEWDHYPEGGRNMRTVWRIPTQPYPGAHFATFPEELPRKCILAGCPERVCRVCGKPSERITERVEIPYDLHNKKTTTLVGDAVNDMRMHNVGGQRYQNWLEENPPETVGWTSCGHDDWRPGVVLDPFAGSGTTLLVARNHQRHSVGIELNTDYCQLAAGRLQQLSLLNQSV